MAKGSRVKRLPPKSAKPKRDALTAQLLAAIDQMQDLAPGVVAQVHDAPQNERSRTAWRMVARFVFPGGSTYDDILIVLRDWRDDRRIEKAIGSSRLARIQVRYKDKKGRGSHGEYTLSEIGSWEFAVSRATQRVGSHDDRLDSLINRYGADGDKSISYIDSLIVWFSPHTAKDIKIGKDRTKAVKGRRRI